MFGKNLLYFSYGGVFYRKSKLQTEQTTELPVALVFSPAAMNLISKLFPFDSGAMAENKFGTDWTRKLSPFDERFSVTTTDALTDARRLVYHLFETNRKYIKGVASTDARHKKDPLPLLHEFLNSDLSSFNIDHRQRTIEAISEVPVQLAQHLLWIGMPQWRTSTVLSELFEWTDPIVPQCHTYDCAKNFNPAEIAARLEDKAFEFVVKRYSDLLV